MSCMKSLLLSQADHIYALVAECPGFSVQAEDTKHIDIACPNARDATSMALILTEDGFPAEIVNRRTVRASLNLSAIH